MGRRLRSFRCLEATEGIASQANLEEHLCMNAKGHRRGLASVGVLAALLIAIPVAGADPSPSAPPGQSKPDKTEKAPKAEKGPEVTVTVTGTVAKTTDDQGRPAFTLTADGKTWQLSAGPPWFWGDKNPLKAFVGKDVVVVGSSHEGEAELDVETVDGTALREGGKPPWAGGPWVVGETHPGWKPWMADGKPGKGLGIAGAPGQNKDKTKDKTPDSDEPSGD